MPRSLSDGSIAERVFIAYHLAQALARNPDYQADIRTLRKGLPSVPAPSGRGPKRDKSQPLAPAEPGFAVDEGTGRLVGFPTGRMGLLFKDVCQRSHLPLLWLPERLKAMTVEDLEKWDEVPVFDFVPGWTLKAKPGFKWHHGRRGLRRVPVPLSRLRKRHRGLWHIYFECWRVFDLRAQGRTDRQILRALWPDLDPDYQRQRVYDRLNLARAMIAGAYQASPFGESSTADRGPRSRRRLSRTPSP